VSSGLDGDAARRARELLGRTLFFDPRLSGSNWIACASCHNPGFSWGDGLPLAVGNQMRTLALQSDLISALIHSGIVRSPRAIDRFPPVQQMPS